MEVKSKMALYDWKAAIPKDYSKTGKAYKSISSSVKYFKNHEKNYYLNLNSNYTRPGKVIRYGRVAA
jgi:hypothetical protein